jgi:glycosyltransferase involved in cell wall biosynthesis
MPVKFLGHRNDLARVFAAADIHCQPNTGPEPFGVAFVEALYAGLPVISTRMGGAAEIVSQTCGILVNPGDEKALARTLRDLMADSSRRSQLSANGPARATELCHPRIVLPMLRNKLQAVAMRASSKVRAAS